MPTLLVVAAVVLLALVGIAFAAPEPLVRERADPHVLKATDGFYYLAATVPAYDRVELRRARTIAGLATAEAKTIWTKRPTGPMGAHIWAPELHQIGGQWVVYFAAGGAEDVWAIRMFALACADADPLAGAWRELGQINSFAETFALDGTTFEHNGERYYAWAQHTPPDRTNTDLYLAKLKSPTELATPPVRISKPEFAWEKIGFAVNEGPAALVRNGRVFLAYSAAKTDANYCVGLLTADADADLLDPASWKKSAEPVLRSDAARGLYGPGHNSFTVDEAGRDVMVFHARAYKDVEGDPLHNPDRHTFARRVVWAEDGTPEFDGPDE